MKQDSGHWKTSKKLNPDKAIGFVYLIRNKTDGRIYLGKKFYRVLKGKHRGKPHPWKTYQSSSTELKEDIKRQGAENFEFHLIEEYFTLGGLSWAEVWSLTTEAIPENNDRFYNRRIDKVSWKVTEPVTNYHKRRMKYLINKK